MAGTETPFTLVSLEAMVEQAETGVTEAMEERAGRVAMAETEAELP
jgi:hypothetical protein